MTRDDIIRMARESGLLIPSFRIGGGLALGTCAVQDFERFAALVAQAEREACAAICDNEANRMEESAQRATENGEHDEVSAIRSTAWKLSVAAARIRKRGAA